MSPTPVEQLVQVRLSQSKESLLEAQTLFKAGLYRGTVNRAYYAMFYAVLSLAVLRQEVTSKHSGVITFFDREFIKPGLLARDLSRVLHFAYQRRQENDYASVYTVSEEEAHQAITDAHSFIESIEIYLGNIHNDL